MRGEHNLLRFTVSLVSDVTFHINFRLALSTVYLALKSIFNKI